MPERHPVQTTYRGQTYSGEWYVEDAQVRLLSAYGQASESVATGRFMQLPSEKAERMLWSLLRARDPKPPFYYWFWR
jgi:hypothetical protein